MKLMQSKKFEKLILMIMKGKKTRRGGKRMRFLQNAIRWKKKKEKKNSN